MKQWHIVVDNDMFSRYVYKKRITAKDEVEAASKLKAMLPNIKQKTASCIRIETSQKCKEFPVDGYCLRLEETTVQNWMIWCWKGKPTRYSCNYSKKNVDILEVYSAPTREDALAYYKAYVKKNGIKDCYYDVAFRCMHENDAPDFYVNCHGMITGIEDLEDEIDEDSSNKNFMKSDIDRCKEDIANYAITGHSKNEWFDLYSHIIDDLLYNIPILIKKCTSYPTKYNSIKEWKKTLSDFYLHLRLHQYYSGFGIVDKNDAAMMEIDKKYRKTIPYYEGTWKSINYEENAKLVEHEWSIVSKWLFENFMSLWD